jgi:hypothetical protein
MSCDKELKLPTLARLANMNVLSSVQASKCILDKYLRRQMLPADLHKEANIMECPLIVIMPQQNYMCKCAAISFLYLNGGVRFFLFTKS